jgi:hypothetical protein
MKRKGTTMNYNTILLVSDDEHPADLPPACPHCGKREGPIWIRQSFWFYCADHKVKWLAGYDLSRSDDLEDDEKRRFNEVGIGDFTYIGPDAKGYYAARRDG